MKYNKRRTKEKGKVIIIIIIIMKAGLMFRGMVEWVVLGHVLFYFLKTVLLQGTHYLSTTHAKAYMYKKYLKYY